MTATAPLTGMQTKMLVMSVGDSYRVPVVFPMADGTGVRHAALRVTEAVERFATLRSRPRHDRGAFTLEIGVVPTPDVGVEVGDPDALLRSGALRATPDVPFRAAVVRAGSGEVSVAAEMHHIAIDGPSLPVLAAFLAGTETPPTTPEDVRRVQEQVSAWEREQDTVRASDDPVRDPVVDDVRMGSTERLSVDLDSDSVVIGARAARVSARAHVQAAFEVAAERVLSGSSYGVTQSWRWGLDLDRYVGCTPVIVERRIGVGTVAERAQAVSTATADPRIHKQDRVVEAPTTVFSYESFGSTRYVEVDRVPKSVVHVRYVDLGRGSRVVCEYDDRRMGARTAEALVSEIVSALGAGDRIVVGQR
ncbi:hypothetical protein [Curtobacterium poinsettiae]|uniref:hypothetical protein n=1 Tax=Curtobacterium poinsettiae TaxID=159612 RepID=UPI002361B71A|nr:hypothetical protein [Curtobacterium flaccumfaciens]MDD1385995.1 hypothetical protein [Curtobacterium flaccumfaciens pv. poinsettiae]